MTTSIIQSGLIARVQLVNPSYLKVQLCLFSTINQKEIPLSEYVSNNRRWWNTKYRNVVDLIKEGTDPF